MQTAEVCRATAGKFRIVHFDARDNFASPHFESESIAEIKRTMNEMMWPQQNECRVYNDIGESVEIPTLENSY